ncbi:hypothetical protein IFM89_021587 [Coptis chinensis]|uniref:Uncharacterized protein n=1 Tax=Coptis chinensis TaxID=261450 RepID=A0A835IBY8_9MAGN|nr:hypothetical protein IFM89_021587 [Coptis chinensis]
MDMSPVASSDAHEKFKKFQLQEELDIFHPKAHLPVELRFLKKRSKIMDIIVAKDVIFALTQSGACAAFSLLSSEHIGFLNISSDQIIRSLFYNANNESLITVSIHASDHYTSLTCKTTSIECIKRNHLYAGVPLFESESLKWPGFVEFDDVNGKVITYSDSIYKVFELKDYSFLYSISEKNIQDSRLGILLLIFNRDVDYLPVKLLSIENGTVIKSFRHLLQPNKEVINSEVIKVSCTELMSPSDSIFLYEQQMFLTFRNRTISAWNLQGKQMTSFQDHLLYYTDLNRSTICTTTDQNIIISYCRDEGAEMDKESFAVGSINISNILTGRCVAKISSSDPNLRSIPRGRMRRSLIQSTICQALEEVTAVFYDEDHNEIYTGNRKGLIHVWSNAPISSKIYRITDD